MNIDYGDYYRENSHVISSDGGVIAYFIFDNITLIQHYFNNDVYLLYIAIYYNWENLVRKNTWYCIFKIIYYK